MRAVRNRRLRQSEPRGSPAGSVIGLQTPVAAGLVNLAIASTSSTTTSARPSALNIEPTVAGRPSRMPSSLPRVRLCVVRIFLLASVVLAPRLRHKSARGPIRSVIWLEHGAFPRGGASCVVNGQKGAGLHARLGTGSISRHRFGVLNHHQRQAEVGQHWANVGRAYSLARRIR